MKKRIAQATRRQDVTAVAVAGLRLAMAGVVMMEQSMHRPPVARFLMHSLQLLA